MPEFAVIITECGGEFTANCPDIPSCWGFGSCPDEALENLRAAVRSHLKQRIQQCLPVPVGSVEVGYLEVGKVRGYARSAKSVSQPLLQSAENRVLSIVFGVEPSRN